MGKIPFAFDADLLQIGIKAPVFCDFQTWPMLLVVGATGSGKSYAMALLLGKIAKYDPNSHFIICDYKRSSFAFAEQSKSFYGYNATSEGIDFVYEEFSARLEANDEKRNRDKWFLIIDEFGAFILSLEKKTAEIYKNRIAEMLFMGRSLGISIIIGVQRAEAEYFKNGARDQFGAIILLGNLSKEQKAMLIPDYKDLVSSSNSRGQGYLYLDGLGLTHIQVPKISSLEQLHKAILSKMSVPMPAE